jgi:hypothetical protein
VRLYPDPAIILVGDAEVELHLPASMEKGIFPHSRALEEQGLEARRLASLGITRAKGPVRLGRQRAPPDARLRAAGKNRLTHLGTFRPGRQLGNLLP